MISDYRKHLSRNFKPIVSTALMFNLAFAASYGSNHWIAPKLGDDPRGKFVYEVTGQGGRSYIGALDHFSVETNDQNAYGLGIWIAQNQTATIDWGGGNPLVLTSTVSTEKENNFKAVGLFVGGSNTVVFSHRGSNDIIFKVTNKHGTAIGYEADGWNSQSTHMNLDHVFFSVKGERAYGFYFDRSSGIVSEEEGPIKGIIEGTKEAAAFEILEGNNNVGKLVNVDLKVSAEHAFGIKLEKDVESLIFSRYPNTGQIIFKKGSITGEEEAAGIYALPKPSKSIQIYSEFSSGNPVVFGEGSISGKNAYGIEIGPDTSSGGVRTLMVSDLKFDKDSIQGKNKSVGVFIAHDAGDVYISRAVEGGVNIFQTGAISHGKLNSAFYVSSNARLKADTDSIAFRERSVGGEDSPTSSLLYFERGGSFDSKLVDSSGHFLMDKDSVIGQSASLIYLSSVQTGEPKNKTSIVNGLSLASPSQASIHGIKEGNLIYADGSKGAVSAIFKDLEIESDTVVSDDNLTFIHLSSGSDFTLKFEGSNKIRPLSGSGNTYGYLIDSPSSDENIHLSFENPLTISLASKNKSVYGVYFKRGGGNINFLADSNVLISSQPAPKDQSVYLFYNEGENVTIKKGGGFADIRSGSQAYQQVAFGFYDELSSSLHFAKNTTFQDISSGSKQASGIYSALGGMKIEFADSSSLLEFKKIKSDSAEANGIVAGGDLNISGNGLLAFDQIEGKTGSAAFKFMGGNNDTISIHDTSLYFGLSGTQSGLASMEQNGTITLDHSLLAINFQSPISKIENDPSNSHQLTLNLTNGSRVILGGTNGKYTIDTLKANGSFDHSLSNFLANTKDFKGNVIDLSSTPSLKDGKIVFDDVNQLKDRDQFRTLIIGDTSKANSKGLEGDNLLFRLYVNPNGSDHVVVDKAIFGDKQTQQNHFIQAIFSQEGIKEINKNGFNRYQDIVLAKVKDDLKNRVIFHTFTPDTEKSSKNLLSVGGGFNYFLVDMKQADHDGYHFYYIPKGSHLYTGEIQQAYVDAGIQANLSLYQAFLSNLDTINKRMGELRNDPTSVGVWTRIFNGRQTLNFNHSNQSNYTTAQVGVDKRLAYSDSSLYIGGALAYTHNQSDFQNQRVESLSPAPLNSSKIHSGSVDVYVSYIQDNGWYEDTDAKFSFFYNKLGTSDDQSYSANAFGVLLQEEVGYRFNVPQNFFIDPQMQVGVGYLSDQKLTQKSDLGDLSISEDGVIDLKSRVGVNWGYDFKDFFDADSKANAKLYVGTYYVYEGILQGDNHMESNGKHADLNPYESSNHRFVLNAGTSIAFNDQTRIYMDAEKSFGGDIRTDYAINAGVRVAFGLKNQAKEEIHKLETQESEANQDHSKVSALPLSQAKLQKTAIKTTFYLEILKSKDKLSKQESDEIAKYRHITQLNPDGSTSYLVGPYSSEIEAQSKISKISHLLEVLHSSAKVVKLDK
ncbi:autotransporter outer membrane beta-barrel domain-containing protein [Helicobacter pametensis]|uniref:autotransporter outer membrane beta-barrel domain-containing protein n=1 Tax=Helicobacter pametensis TaxID=95149 RepID=UPI0004AD82E8|nr:autotransporter outer membrane beta-barrel domain-containing protein [Helicobacter pametensis]